MLRYGAWCFLFSCCLGLTLFGCEDKEATLLARLEAEAKADPDNKFKRWAVRVYWNIGEESKDRGEAMAKMSVWLEREAIAPGFIVDYSLSDDTLVLDVSTKYPPLVISLPNIQRLPPGAEKQAEISKVIKTRDRTKNFCAPVHELLSKVKSLQARHGNWYPVNCKVNCLQTRLPGIQNQPERLQEIQEECTARCQDGPVDFCTEVVDAARHMMQEHGAMFEAERPHLNPHISDCRFTMRRELSPVCKKCPKLRKDLYRLLAPLLDPKPRK